MKKKKQAKEQIHIPKSLISLFEALVQFIDPDKDYDLIITDNEFTLEVKGSDSVAPEWFLNFIHEFSNLIKPLYTDVEIIKIIPDIKVKFDEYKTRYEMMNKKH